MKRFCLLLVILVLVAGNGNSTKELFATSPIPVEIICFDGDDSNEYRQTEEPNADIVLVVEFSISPWTEPDTYRVPLKHNTNSTNRRLSYSSGWAACGGGGGCGGNLRIETKDAKTLEIEVSLSLRWSSKGGEKGNFEHKWLAPWNGDVKHDASDGNWMRVHFEKPRTEGEARKTGFIF